MSLKYRKKNVFTVLLMLSVMLLDGCSEPQSDEALIMAQIDILQNAVEQHDQGAFMAVIDPHYQDPLNASRKSLHRMLLGFFLRYKDIRVFISATRIELQNIRAEAHSQVVVSGGAGIIPDNARHYQLTSCWKKVSDEWLLSCLEWE